MNGNVCPSHVQDRHLARSIRLASDETTPCTFCDAGSAASFTHLHALISDAISRKFVSLDSGRSEYFDEEPEFLSAPDMLDEVLFEAGVVEPVASALRQMFESNFGYREFSFWYRRGGRETHQAARRLSSAWAEFCHEVKHESRFFPDSSGAKTGSSRAPSILGQIREFLLYSGLVRTLEPGVAIYRARAFDEIELPGPHCFSAPPAPLAAQGRMNAAGVPVFYGALDAETAAIEVYRSDYPRVGVARFTLLKQLCVVDLTHLPSRSPFADSVDAYSLIVSEFLERFVAEISRPVSGSDRVHQDYAPTQYLTEYLRFHLQPPEPHERLGGMLYPSAITGSTSNIVVFTNQFGSLNDGEIPPEMGARSEVQILECAPKGYAKYSYGPPRLTAQRTVGFGLQTGIGYERGVVPSTAQEPCEDAGV